jgi:hypothetical protein
LRGRRVLDPDIRHIQLGSDAHVQRQRSLRYAEIDLEVGDRIVVCTDGVTQSGMGTRRYPLGWRRKSLVDFLTQKIERAEDISARELATSVSMHAHSLDAYASKDDITCGVLYCRKPRHTLVVSGPPFDVNHDGYLVERIRQFKGKRIICGGTTATIASHHLGSKIEVDYRMRSRGIPPIARMEGFDLVTEGMLTLNRTASLLEGPSGHISCPEDGAEMLFNHLLESDRVSFIVGTRINEAHQNPDMPQDMGIRRTLVRRIADLLRANYLKETEIEFI